MEPSRKGAGRRRRKLLALARELEEEFGPDQSVVVFEYGDGWTMRRVDRLEDQIREGRLARNCLASITELDQNVYSLRDPDNLPHLTPSVFRVALEADLDWVPLDRPIDKQVWFVRAREAMFLVDAARSGGLRSKRRAQLVRYALEADPSGWQPFPTEPRDWLEAMMPFFNLQGRPDAQERAEQILRRYRAQVEQFEALERIRRVNGAAI